MLSFWTNDDDECEHVTRFVVRRSTPTIPFVVPFEAVRSKESKGSATGFERRCSLLEAPHRATTSINIYLAIITTPNQGASIPVIVVFPLIQINRVAVTVARLHDAT